MKSLVILTILYITAICLWVSSDQWSFKSQNYVDEKVLDLSRPIDVKIDVELLNSLKPANE